MPDLNVLVVDDSKTARFAMRRHLERLETLVQTAASAMEAYDYLKDHRPDVIFMDNVMPEISGLEALIKLKHDEKTAIIPVIFCTSIETAEFIEQARASGALQVLHKPPNLEQLSKLLQDIRARPLTQTVVNGEHAEPAAVESLLQMPATEEMAPAIEEPAPALSNGSSPAETLHLHHASMAPVAGRVGDLRHEIDQGMRQLTDEICQQLSELKTQLHDFDPKGLTSSELEIVHHVAQEENAGLRTWLGGELEQVRARLDHLERIQQERYQQLVQAMHEAAIDEIRAFREQMLKEATAQISEHLSRSLLQALANPSG